MAARAQVTPSTASDVLSELESTSAETAMAKLGAHEVHEGANLVLIETKSAGELLFRKNDEGVWLASPVQVYLDLLRKERIRF